MQLIRAFNFSTSPFSVAPENVKLTATECTITPMKIENAQAAPTDMFVTE